MPDAVKSTVSGTFFLPGNENGAGMGQIRRSHDFHEGDCERGNYLHIGNTAAEG